MPHSPIIDSLIFLVVAVVVTPLCRRVGVSPILGYLLAGTLIGPHGLHVIAETDSTRLLAELGIVFLLFMIGLELSPERLRVIRHYIFGLGSAQVAVTAGLIGGGAVLMGMEPRAAIVVGMALAFSSTAFVLQVLNERGELTSQSGRVAIAVLILQDLAVVPLLVLVPMLGASESSILSAVGIASAKAIAAMLVIVVVARIAIRPLFKVVADAKSPEVFVAAALLVVIGTSFATEHAGLSLSLGAFLAGVMLASTEYRHQVEADLQPIRGLLLGLFFLTVGMVIDPGDVLVQWAPLLAILAALVAVKALVIAGLGLLFRFPAAVALNIGLLLAQGGEFAFVVLGRAEDARLLSAQTAGLLMTVVALSMALTPALAALGEAALRRRQQADGERNAPDSQVKDLTDHVILCGFGRVGQTVASVLRQMEIPFVAIDRVPQTVEQFRERGDMIYYGDARKLDLFRSLGAARARAIILTIDSGSTRERIVTRLRKEFPSIHLLARARDRRQQKNLEAMGADVVVPEAVEGSLQLAGALLRLLGAPPDEIREVIDGYRRNDYAKLLEQVPKVG